MILNDIQKEILVDNMFDSEDLDWMERSLEELKAGQIEITEGANGWWNMYVDGSNKVFTELNFGCFCQVLSDIIRNK